MKIEPYDIIDRIARAKPEFWFNTKPKVRLTGKDNTFGTLSFEFEDDIVKYKILIKDRENILSVAKDAINHFREYCIYLYQT